VSLSYEFFFFFPESKLMETVDKASALSSLLDTLERASISMFSFLFLNPIS
jgi:hypothetical protein